MNKQKTVNNIDNVPKNKQKQQAPVNRRKRNRNRNNRKRVVPKKEFHLSACSSVYAKALINPHAMLKDVCIPDIHDLPSLKLRTLIRGECSVGVNFGFIVLSPKSASNDGVAALTSISSFAGLTMPDPGVAGTVQINDVQYPYNVATAGNLQARTAACGVRVRYIGTELTKSGQVYMFRFPTGQSAFALTPAQIKSRPDTIVCQVDRKWTGISYIPSLTTDYDYSSSPFVIPSGGANEQLGIILTGSAANAFEFEIVYYHELVSGTLPVAGITPTHSDIIGLSATRNVLEGSNFKTGEGSWNIFNQMLKTYNADDVSGFVDTTSTVITGAKTLYNLL